MPKEFRRYQGARRSFAMAAQLMEVATDVAADTVSVAASDFKDDKLRSHKRAAASFIAKEVMNLAATVKTIFSNGSNAPTHLG